MSSVFCFKNITFSMPWETVRTSSLLKWPISFLFNYALLNTAPIYAYVQNFSISFWSCRRVQKSCSSHSFSQILTTSKNVSFFFGSAVRPADDWNRLTFLLPTWWCKIILSLCFFVGLSCEKFENLPFNLKLKDVGAIFPVKKLLYQIRWYTCICRKKIAYRRRSTYNFRNPFIVPFIKNILLWRIAYVCKKCLRHAWFFNNVNVIRDSFQ